MIEIGTVNKHNKATGTITVEFAHIGTSVDCSVLQTTTGKNTMFAMPSIGTQVVCWLESGKNIALGAVFSDSEKAPSETSEKGILYNIDATKFGIDDNKVTFENDSTSLLKLFEEVLKIISALTVSTSTGPSGTPLPPTVQAIEELKQTLKQFFK